MPFVFFNVIEAIYPLLDNSAATKYSPEIPANMPFLIFFIFPSSFLQILTGDLGYYVFILKLCGAFATAVLNLDYAVEKGR
jgi:hypothetical protein